MKRFFVIFELSMFFVAIIANSQDHESSNVIYVTNTVEKPIYVEKLITKTNTVEKIVQIEVAATRNSKNTTLKGQQDSSGEFTFTLFAIIFGLVAYRVMKKRIDKFCDEEGIY